MSMLASSSLERLTGNREREAAVAVFGLDTPVDYRPACDREEGGQLSVRSVVRLAGCHSGGRDELHRGSLLSERLVVESVPGRSVRLVGRDEVRVRATQG